MSADSFSILKIVGIILTNPDTFTETFFIITWDSTGKMKTGTLGLQLNWHKIKRFVFEAYGHLTPASGITSP